MNVEKVKMLLRAIELQSMSKAAEEFSYTPSAFSHIADSVEDELGVKILLRTHNGTELTKAGKVLLDKLKNLVKAENELIMATKDLRPEKTIIRIGTYSSISQFILPKLIKGFKAKNPDIGISIFVRENIKNLLQKDVVDITLADDSEEKGSKLIPLFDEPFVAVMPKSFNQFKNVVNREDLYRYTFIRPLDTRVKRYFDTEKFKEVIEINSADDALILQMVKEEIGITVLPTLTIKNHKHELNVLKLEPELKRSLSLMYLETNKKRKSIKKFIVYMQQAYNFENKMQ